jgi:hypothetical protein
MKNIVPSFVVLFLAGASALAETNPPVYLWFEPEWFEGVEGSFGYSSGPASYKATGHWGIAGPGISPEWSTGGESEWNSIGAPPNETKAECRREFVVPRAGKYRLWVRYYDHRGRTEPFTATIQQAGKTAISGELGTQPVVPPNDEFQLYWGFSFGWGSIEGELKEGAARLGIEINKPGEAWRQVDAVLITDDLTYVPVAREKPPFAYVAAATSERSAEPLAHARGYEPSNKRPKLGGQDFTMWVNATSNQKDNWKWWAEQNPDTLTLFDWFFALAHPYDISGAFTKQFAGQKNLPFMSWPHSLPGIYLGHKPDLSPGQPIRRWLERTKTPFFIMTNYAHPAYDETNGPATYAALTGPLAAQFLGYIHGEAVGTLGVAFAHQPLGKTRREHVEALGASFLKQQADLWSKLYKTTVSPAHWAKGISCLSCQSISIAHLFLEMGSETIGYEVDSTNIHVPMRIAFARGAARQYGRSWINYASGNFGDACNYFTQEPIGARGAKSWFHSKYAITDGVSITWYRKLYYLNYLSGAGAIYWEQGLGNQWILPGPGTHPVQLSPFGRATEEFQAFVDRVGDRGEPYTPIAILLNYGHGYDRLNYQCRMLEVFPENRSDLELRELFNFCWYPVGVVEGQPQAPDVQSMPNGRYGNIFDVLVDRPARAKAMFDYPVVIAAGDVDLVAIQPDVEEYVKKGGTLVVNAAASKGLSPKLLGLKLTGRTSLASAWMPVAGALQPTTPFEVAGVELEGAAPIATADSKLPLITRHKVGSGSVIVTLVPHMIGLDERAHPALPWLMDGLTEKLLPVEVRLPDGARPSGEIMYQVNKSKDGWVVMLMNNQGVDKTQNGIARVDRTKYVDIALYTSLPVKSATEFTQPRKLQPTRTATGIEILVRIHPGDVQVVALQSP